MQDGSGSLMQKPQTNDHVEEDPVLEWERNIRMIFKKAGQ